MFGGPGNLRFFIQPAIALLIGIRDGRRDGRAGHPPYLLALVTGKGRRSERVRDALKSLAFSLVVAFGADLLFQALIRERVQIVAAVLYVVVFIVAPYVCSRALTNRATRRRADRPSAP
jgi:hypothetical protein